MRIRLNKYEKGILIGIGLSFVANQCNGAQIVYALCGRVIHAKKPDIVCDPLGDEIV